MNKLKTAFCGTPDFSIPSLQVLQESSDIDLKYVVTMPDRPAGRGKKLTSPPVAQYAQQHNIPLVQTININREEEILKEFKKANLDVIIVIAFSQFFGTRILNLPKLGCFNIHTSLLPKYRGAAPIQYAILNGDKMTGVSIQKMIKQMDAGDLCLQKTVPINDKMTGGELFNVLKKEAALSLKQFIQDTLQDQLTLTPQKETDLSFAPALEKGDGYLSFRERTSEKIYNQIRAFSPWPGTYFYLNGLRLKVLKAEKSTTKIKPGEINTDFGILLIGCQEGSLHLSQVQLEGKKATSDADLINGLKNKFDHFVLSDGE